MVIDAITKAIDARYRLDRDGRRWLVPAAPEPLKLRSPGRRSVGFSLDQDGSPALAFFSSKPPKNLARICDGMIAVLHEQRLYLFAIEVKSGHKGDSSVQLVNGRIFWRWLMNLCERHGYMSEVSDVAYISVLAWRPRKKSARKGTTAHSVGNGLEKLRKIDGFTARFEARNHEDISLIDFIRRT